MTEIFTSGDRLAACRDFLSLDLGTPSGPRTGATPVVSTGAQTRLPLGVAGLRIRGSLGERAAFSFRRRASGVPCTRNVALRASTRRVPLAAQQRSLTASHPEASSPRASLAHPGQAKSAQAAARSGSPLAVRRHVSRSAWSRPPARRCAIPSTGRPRHPFRLHGGFRGTDGLVFSGGYLTPCFASQSGAGPGAPGRTTPLAARRHYYDRMALRGSAELRSSSWAAASSSTGRACGRFRGPLGYASQALARPAGALHGPRLRQFSPYRVESRRGLIYPFAIPGQPSRVHPLAVRRQRSVLCMPVCVSPLRALPGRTHATRTTGRYVGEVLGPPTRLAAQGQQVQRQHTAPGSPFSFCSPGNGHAGLGCPVRRTPRAAHAAKFSPLSDAPHGPAYRVGPVSGIPRAARAAQSHRRLTRLTASSREPTRCLLFHWPPPRRRVPRLPRAPRALATHWPPIAATTFRRGPPDEPR